MGAKAPGTAGWFIWQSRKTQNSTTYYYNHSGAREQEEFLLEYKFLVRHLPQAGIAKNFNDVARLSVCCLTGKTAAKRKN
jgi:hypothetical protein